MTLSANVGDTIKIIKIALSDNTKDEGKIGIVEYVDDMGILHGTWGPFAIFPRDEYEIITSN